MSASLEAFLNVLRRSGLVDESAIARALETCPQHQLPPTADTFAQRLVESELITQWQATKLLQGKYKGFFLGKYKLLRLLGKGGMSSVYLAEHVLMRRRCAIKVLPWKLVKDSSYLQRFHREAQAVASLDHPNIVRAYDVDHEKDGNLEIHFLVMEYVEGRNLFDLVQQSGPLPAVTAAEYIRQGALGLAHAHAEGMVHRDVKPGNFIVDQNGTVKLMDLGLARISTNDGDHSLTVAHDEKVLGTADYLAPEQAVDSHLVDARADLYSLGCTMYFLLTGRPPFNEGTLTQRLLAHQTKEPTPVRELRTDVPESLLSILQLLMKKNPDERIQTAAEVAAHLENWLSCQTTDSGKRLAVTPIPPGVSSRTAGESVAQSGPAAAIDAPTRKINRDTGSDIADFFSSLSDIEAEDETPNGARSRTPLASSGPGSSSKSRKTSRRSADSSRNEAPGVPAVSDSSVRQTQQDPGAESIFPSTADSSGKGLDRSKGGAKSSRAVAGSGRVTRSSRILDSIKNYQTPLVMTLAALVILVGYLLFSRDTKPRKVPPAQQQAAARPTEGSQQASPMGRTNSTPARPAVNGQSVSVGPNGNFGTVTEAINYIKTQNMNTTSPKINEIRIEQGATLEESIVIDNSGLGMFPRGIRLTGSEINPPRFIPKGNEAVFALTSVDDLTLENIVISCQGTAQGIRLEGFMAGVMLKNVTFENIQQTAVTGIGLAGVRNRTVVIENCRFQGGGGSAQAILLLPGKGQDSRELTIRKCSFLGPLQTAVTVDGNADNINFSQNIFHEIETAIRFVGLDPMQKDLTFTNNTFHRCQQGIVFVDGPTDAASNFVFQKNLFIGGSGPAVQTRTDRALTELTSEGRPSRWNWTDRTEAQSGNLPIFTNEGRYDAQIVFQSVTPGESNFLKPESKELMSAAKTADSPKYIGAVSP
jgi:Serine/threonine protein kinase